MSLENCQVGPTQSMTRLLVNGNVIASMKVVVTLRHPSKGGPVGTSSDDGIRRDPSRLRVVGLKLALCELVGQQTEETFVETFLIYY